MRRRVVALLLGIAMLFSEFSSLPHVFSVSAALAEQQEEQIEGIEDVGETESLNDEQDSAAEQEESIQEPQIVIAQTQTASGNAAQEMQQEKAAQESAQSAAEEETPDSEPDSAKEETTDSEQDSDEEETPDSEPDSAKKEAPDDEPDSDEEELSDVGQILTVEAISDSEQTSNEEDTSDEEPASSEEETPDGEQDNSAEEETPDGEQDNSAEEETPDGEQDNSAEEETPDGEKDNSAEEETPDGEQDDSAGEETPDGEQDDSAGEETSDSEQDNSAGEETPDGEQDDSAGEETPDGEQEPVEEEQLPVLEVSIRSSINHLFVGEGGVSVTATVCDGVAPFEVELRVSVNGETRSAETFYLDTAGTAELTYYPESAGDYVAAAYVTDAAGRQTSASVTTLAAVHAVEYPASWEKSVADVRLSGDWREDIVAIAQSQLGYQESRINFIIEDGVRKGYTRYGDWYGAPYAQWCGMFVAFCQEYAGISPREYPRSAGVCAYMEALDELDALEDSDYTPERGDLVFFMWEKDETPSHMGIVENVDGANLYTIEGNSASVVQRKSYSLYSDDIIGYANTKKLMDRAGVTATKTAEPDIELTGMATTVKDSVNMRTLPSQDGAFVRRIRKMGTRVTLLGAADQADVRWYLVKFNDAIGYVRGDLLELQARENEELQEELPLDADEAIETENAAAEEELIFELETENEVQANQEETQEEELFFGVSDTTLLSDTAAVVAQSQLVMTIANPQAGQSEEIDTEYVCGLEAHAHSEACVNETGEVVCGAEEHEHTEACVTAEETEPEEAAAEYVCGLEAHAHSEACINGTGEVVCGAEEHEHTEACVTAEEADPEEAAAEYVCGLEAHAHSEACVNETGEVVCGAEEHEHGDACLAVVRPVRYDCGLEEHAHADDCFNGMGIPACGLEEHAHGDDCIMQIEALAAMLTGNADQFSAGESNRVIVEAAVSGGYAPYTVTANVYQADVLLQSAQLVSETGEIRFFYVPEQDGEYTAEVLVTDLDGATTQENLTMTVVMPAVYYCGLEEHAHVETCCDETGSVICGLEEHTHDETCLIVPVEEPETEVLTLTPDENGKVSFSVPLNPEYATTFVDVGVYDGENEIVRYYDGFSGETLEISFTAEHLGEYTARVIVYGWGEDPVIYDYIIVVQEAPDYFCGLEAHAHSDTCLNEAGETACGLEEHTHDLYCTAEKIEIVLQADAQELKYNEAFQPVLVSAKITGGVAPYTMGMRVRAVETQTPTEEQAAETQSGEPEAASAEPEQSADEPSAETKSSDETAQEQAAIANATEDTAAETADEAANTEESQVEPTEHSFTFLPEFCGEHTVIVSVTDADGREAQAEIVVNVARQVAIWEEALTDVVLTGNSREDILALAHAQLGYRETVLETAALESESATQVYTIYGDWYGEQRDEWSSLFASFVLHYANLRDFPLSPDAAAWARTLEEAGLYRAAAGYMPMQGDLVFLDTDGDGVADDTAIVGSVDVSIHMFRYDPETKVMTPENIDLSNAIYDFESENPYNVWKRAGEIRLIAGDVEGSVAEISLDVTDPLVRSAAPALLSLTADAEPEIVGYVSVSGSAESDEVAAVIRLIDAMPSEQEYNDLLNAYDESESEEDYNALMEAQERIEAAYYAYMNLLPEQRAYVTNLDKFMALEYVWSKMVLIEDITSDSPTRVSSASTASFIQLNLYDYNGSVNTNYNNDNDWPGFQWNGGAYHRSGTTYNRNSIDYIDFGNSLITDFDYEGTIPAKATSAQNIGNQGGNINKIVEYPEDDWANQPVGMSTGTEVLGRNLTTAGYPRVTDAGSMVDYFSDSSFATKKNSSSIDGLFQINDTSGAYYFNSRWNHAQYSGNRFTLYEDIITPNFITYPFGNFLPFNSITNGNTSTQVSKISAGKLDTYVQELINDLIAIDDNNPSAHQLWEMLARYRENLKTVTVGDSTAWESWSAKDAIYDYIGNGPTDDTGPITDALLDKMYNIDWDVDTNFFFGMEMKMNFMMPKDGLTGKDNGNNETGSWAYKNDIARTPYLTGTPDGISDYPMTFYFTGDDDVWVYIDGVLFLDLSGIHRHVGGQINFEDGTVQYFALDPATGDVSASAYATYTFEELLTAAGKSTDVLNAKGTFKDYSTHQFNFYYMERGSGSSVCRLNFNFPLLKQNSISVTKELTGDKTTWLGDPDYKFQVLKANDDSSLTETLFIGAGVTYTIYKGDTITGEVIGTGTTDANGVFTLKAGQSALFEGIEESAGKYYVRELLDGNELEQYGTITVAGTTATKQDNVQIGSSKFTGVLSPVQDMSNGSTAFRFVNDFSADKMGSLSLTKRIAQGAAYASENTLYKFIVTLDGNPLPVGTEYEVYSNAEAATADTRTVTEAGIVELKADEVIRIVGILAGSEYKIEEQTKDYKIDYDIVHNDGNLSQVVVDSETKEELYVEGAIRTEAAIEIIATNTAKGAMLEVPVTKTMAYSDGTSHAYTFLLQMLKKTVEGYEVDSNGYSDEVTITVPAESTKLFDTMYFPPSMIGDTYYYQITELNPGNDYTTIYDPTAYVLEVAVTEDEVGNVVATPTYGTWKTVEGETSFEPLGSGETFEFTNTLIGDLSISKKINGVATTAEFPFAIALAGNLLPGAYTATTYDENWTEVKDSRNPTAITVQEPANEGDMPTYSATIYLKQNETFVIYDLPVGTTWTIKEYDTYPDTDYAPSITINYGAVTDQVSEDGATATGTVVTTNPSVTITNTQLFELPSTGGPGTFLYTMGGWLLIAVSIFLLYNQRKNRKEGYET